jgi:protocatechuate 3,4-dioxygenase beta subunit
VHDRSMSRNSRWTDADGTPIDEEDRGLVYDVQTLLTRRRALGLIGGLGIGALVTGCVGADTDGTTGSAGGATTASGSASSGPSASAGSTGLTEVPDETSGPFPADGSNGVDALDDSGIVRSDIRSSFGTSTATAAGVPLTIRLTVRDPGTGDARKGLAVYLWHCDREGRYSLYTDGLEDVNYLRGVQPTDGTGTVELRSVFPGCYDGRWPHIHFEVYDDLAGATTDGPIVKTSQIALPKEACNAVYATTGYEQSADNLTRTSLTSDMVFADDGAIHQLASMSGSVDTGFVAALTIGV